MKIEFAGAAQHVTGSKHLLHINGKKILLDCGLFQGHRKQTEEANRYLPFDANEIDALVLSHAHIDHCGAIPFLVKSGFEGPIYCTHATRDLCAIMLRDSAYIQEREAEWWKEKKGEYVAPLYTIADAEKSLSYFRSVGYNQKVRISNEIKFTFYDAGHILGSAMEQWEIYDQDTAQDISFGFTGDLGRRDLPVLKDPGQLTNLDVLLTESTYGNRLHDEIKDVEVHLAKTIKDTIDRGGKIFIPAFAMGRTQEILYVLKELMGDNKIPEIPIFVDSPLATSATEVFALHPECYDKDLKELLEEGNDPFCSSCNGIQFTRSVDESKALQNFPGSCIIISASGMCEFGRIRHHLKNNLDNGKNTLLIVGYQAENTLGRKLVEGENPVNIFGDPVSVNAEVVIYNAFSGHADQKELLSFAAETGTPKSVFFVHGEGESQEVLSEEFSKLDNLRESDRFIPAPGEIYELQTDKSFKKLSHRNMECEGIVCKI